MWVRIVARVMFRGRSCWLLVVLVLWLYNRIRGGREGVPCFDSKVLGILPVSFRPLPVRRTEGRFALRRRLGFSLRAACGWRLDGSCYCRWRWELV